MRPAKDNLLVTNRQGPAVKAGMPGKTFRELLPPRADHAGNPDHFTRMQRERHIFERACLGQIAHIHQTLRLRHGLSRLAVIFLLQLPPDHMKMQVGDGRFRRRHLGNNTPVAHDKGAIRNVEHFLDPVRNEDNRRPFLDLPDNLEQQADFRLFQHRGRLVQQNGHLSRHAPVKRKRLGNFHHLPVCKRQIRASLARMNIKPDLLQFFRRRGIHPAFRNQPEGEEFLFPPEKNILCHREILDDGLFLKHHGNAIIESIARRCQNCRFAVHQNRARVGLVNPVQNFQNRRFPRPVFADQADNLALPD